MAYPRSSIPAATRELQRAPLKRLLADRSLSQESVAQLLGTDDYIVHRHVGGRCLLTPYWLVRYKRLLNLSDIDFINLVESAAVYEHARGRRRSDRPHPTQAPKDG